MRWRAASAETPLPDGTSVWLAYRHQEPEVVLAHYDFERRVWQSSRGVTYVDPLAWAYVEPPDPPVHVEGWVDLDVAEEIAAMLKV